MIPLMLIAVVNYTKSASILEDKAREQFLYLSEATNQQFNQYVANIDTISMNIVEASIIQSRLEQPYVPAEEWTTKQIQDEAEVKKFLNGIYKLTPGLSGIAIYGYNRIYDFMHMSMNLNQEFNPELESWYVAAQNNNGNWVLSGKRVEHEFISFLTHSKEQVVTFSRLLKNLNTLEPMGILAINIRVSELESILGTDETGRHFIILDQEGRSVLSTAGAEAYMHDENWLQSSSVSPVTGWRSIHLISKQELFKESRDIRNYIILLTLALAIIAVALANFLSSGIVKPLQNLKKRMLDIEKGNFQWKIPVIHRDEVGELTVRFNRMLDRMGELMEDNRLREQQKAQLEMDALQARINPHFLYNTLMALRIQAIGDGNRKLGELINSLIHLLQFSAKNKRKVICLDEELELLRRYVTLLQLRNESFDFHLDIEEGIEHNLVFPFLLQPIVENAIFHGIGPLQRRGNIELIIRTRDGNNIAIVRDDGVGMDERCVRQLLGPISDKDTSKDYYKIGVQNVYERLKLQFGESADIIVESDLGVGTRVTVIWPVSTEGGALQL